MSMNSDSHTSDIATKTAVPEYQLRLARYADLEAIARVWHAAFFDDQVIGQLMHPYRKDYPEDMYWFLLRGNREHYWDWKHQFVVVTVRTHDAQGERIVGAADWRRLGKGGEQRQLVVWDPRKFFPIVTRRLAELHAGKLIVPMIRQYHKFSLKLFPNRAADPAKSGWLDNAVESSEKYWTGDRAECWDLHICGVHPDHQGKGAGRLLAEWGVKEAKKEGENVVASVLCGENNRAFYGKAGMSVQVGKGNSGLALFTR